MVNQSSFSLHGRIGETSSQVLPLALADALREVVGVEAAEQILLGVSDDTHKPLSMAQIGMVEETLKTTFGEAAGRGFALRAGRAAFNQILRRLGVELGFLEMEYRLQPARLRLRTGLLRLGEVLFPSSWAGAQVEERNDRWIWKVSPCRDAGSNSGWHLPRFFLIGVLQEFFAWSSGGKYYLVQCEGGEGVISASVVFEVVKQPLE
jgi:hypothetical protein